MLIFCVCSCSKDLPIEPEATLNEKLQEALETEFMQYNGKGVSAAVLIPGLGILKTLLGFD